MHGIVDVGPFHQPVSPVNAKVPSACWVQTKNSVHRPCESPPYSHSSREGQGLQLCPGAGSEEGQRGSRGALFVVGAHADPSGTGTVAPTRANSMAVVKKPSTTGLEPGCPKGSLYGCT
jgi:hypothetical protein